MIIISIIEQKMVVKLNFGAGRSTVIWVIQLIFTGSTVRQVHFKFPRTLEDTGQWAFGRRWNIFLLPGRVLLGLDSEEPVCLGDKKHGLQEVRPEVKGSHEAILRPVGSKSR